LKRAKGLKEEIGWKVESAVWKARDGDGRADLNGGEGVSCMRVLCIYRTLLAAQKEEGPQDSLPIIAYFYEIGYLTGI